MKNLLNSNLRNPALIFTMICAGLMGIFPVCMAQGGPWTQKAPIPTARFWYSCEVVNGKIYVIGGATANNAPTLATVEEYDPVTDTWTTKADMPTPRYNMSSAVVDGKIYIMGGDSIFKLGWIDGLRTMEVYDPSNDTWDTQKTHMPTGRNGSSACVVNGIIYVMGGVYMLPGDNVGRVLNVVEAYDPATDTWTTKAPMPTGRYALSMPVVNGKIYAMGGSAGGAYGISTVELYDPKVDTWTTKASMLVGNCYFGTGIVDGIIYTIGGWINSGHARVFAYDSEIDEWSEITAMPTTRMGLGAGVVNGKIYAIGGAPHYTMSPLSSNEEYDPYLDLLTLINKIEVDKSYAKPGTDSVCITTKMSDPTGINIMAHIEAHDQSPVDSLQLFDDGNHNDGNADDGLYANCWSVGSSEERPYFVDLKVTRIGSDTLIQRMDNMATFTTIGPVVLESSSDFKSPPARGKKIVLKCTLANEGLTSTAPGIKAKLISLDTSAIVTSDAYFAFFDISPGESFTGAALITITESCPENTPIPMSIDITSNGYSYWSDTFSVVIPSATMTEKNMLQQSDLIQNYPNPCDVLTTISFSLNKSDHVSLIVYDRIGKEVKTLVDNILEPGDHAVHFNTGNLEAGMYIYTLKTGNMVSTGKMMVIQ